MAGFPAELPWLKRREEAGRRDTWSGKDVWGLQWGCLKGEGGDFFSFDL